MTEEYSKRQQKAIRSALNILDYADNTEKKLREKLFRKGYTAEETDIAVEYARKMDYLNESRFLEVMVYSLANTKLYGRRRIIQELYVKGFRREIIAEADFSEIDFIANCCKRVKKTKNNYSDVRKLYEALLRYGFSSDEIKKAFILYKESDKNE